MKLTAREIVGRWTREGTSLVAIERLLGLPFGSLMPLLEEEGPAPPETEVLLNMVNSVPSLLSVAEENFDLRRLVTGLFAEWKEGQKEILAALRK